jgi:hypothetical protein
LSHGPSSRFRRLLRRPSTRPLARRRSTAQWRSTVSRHEARGALLMASRVQRSLGKSSVVRLVEGRLLNSP